VVIPVAALERYLQEKARTAAMSDILEAAFSYISQGFKVFPVKPDKKPLTVHGLKDATQTQSGVREFWTRWPDAGIALVTDGLMVLEL